MSKVFQIALLSFFALSFFQSVKAQNYTPAEQNCFDMVQNKVAWSRSGITDWGDLNIRRLCKGTTNPAARISCFTNYISNIADDWDKGINQCAAAKDQLILNGNWVGYQPADTKTDYVWQIKQTGSSLTFTDVGAGSNIVFNGAIQDRTITDSNNVTGTLSADGKQIVWTNGVVWKKQGSTPQPAPDSEAITRAITIKNTSGMQIHNYLKHRSNYERDINNEDITYSLTKTKPLMIGQSETFGTDISLPLSDDLELWINSDTKPFFKVDLPKNKALTAFCYEVAGTYFVPSVKTCDGSATYESKYIFFKNGAGFNSVMSLTYYPQGSSTAKIASTEVTTPGYERKLYLPLDADTSKQMTLKINVDGLKKNILSRDVGLNDFNTKGSTCYKAWGAAFSAKINPCNESGRKITLQNKGGYPAFIDVTYYDINESGAEVKKSLTGNALQVLETDSVYVPQGSSKKPIQISIRSDWKTLSDPPIATFTAPANFTGELCYKTEGTNINPVASDCDGGKGVSDNDAREIQFNNSAGFDAEMTVTYYEYQDPNLSTAPVAKTISTGLINFNKTRYVKIPKQTAYNKAVSVAIKGYGTFKNNIYSFNLPGGFAYSPKPCFTTWGTIFNPGGGKCDSPDVNKTTYEFAVKTADESGAGTDSNIYVKICGDKGCTSEQQVNSKISGNAFERNQVDKFAYSDTDIGTISYIEVRSDTKYAGSDWNLEWITISTGSRMSVFYVRQWFNGTNTVRLNVNEVR